MVGLKLFSQQISQGCYNDWDYSPNGVHGNLLLTTIHARAYFKIEKIDEKTARIQQFNPSGIVINTTTVTFNNSILNSVKETDQWGEDKEFKNFTKVKDNEFIVTDLSEGVNNYLPCKYARFIYQNELLTEVRYFSFRDQLIDQQNGYAIIHYKRYNDKIRFAEIKEMSFYNSQDLPVMSKSADYHKVIYEYDSLDNKILRTFYGVNNEPIIPKNLNAASRRDFYDEDNNVAKTEFVNLSGALTPNIYGFAVYENQYFNGYMVKEIRYDSLHKISRGFSNSDRVAIIKNEYDNAGNNLRKSYFDEMENPIRSTSGVHEIVNIFSPNNAIVKKTFFDNSGNASIDRDSVHTLIYSKDEKGRTIVAASYDIDGKPIKNFNDDVFMLKYKYDKFGRKVETSYWMDSITPMPRWNGTFISKIKFNEEGQPIEFSYFDKDGKPFRTSDSSSMSRLVYNSDGRIEERQFLYQNNLTSKKDGVTTDYSIIKYGYNQNGKVNELTFFGVDRTPANATIWLDDTFSAHRIEFIYKGSTIVEQWYYTLDTNVPSKKINCLDSDFISTTGIHEGRKNEN